MGHCDETVLDHETHASNRVAEKVASKAKDQVRKDAGLRVASMALVQPEPRWMSRSVMLEPEVMRGLGLDKPPTILSKPPGTPGNQHWDNSDTLGNIRLPDIFNIFATLPNTWHLQPITTRLIRPFVLPWDAHKFELMLSSDFVVMYMQILTAHRLRCVGLDVVYWRNSSSYSAEEFQVRCERMWMNETTKKPHLDWGKKKYFLFPVIQGGHWSMLVALLGCDQVPNQLLYLDSMRTPKDPLPEHISTYAHNIEVMLRKVGKCPGQDMLDRAWTFSTVKVPQQMDGWSCGYHMISFADKISRGVNVTALGVDYNTKTEALHRTRARFGRVALGLQVV